RAQFVADRMKSWHEERAVYIASLRGDGPYYSDGSSLPPRDIDAEVAAERNQFAAKQQKALFGGMGPSVGDTLGTMGYPHLGAFANLGMSAAQFAPGSAGSPMIVHEYTFQSMSGEGGSPQVELIHPLALPTLGRKNSGASPSGPILISGRNGLTEVPGIG